MLNRTEQPLFRPLTDIHIPEPSLVRLNDGMSLYVLHNSEQGVIRIDFMIRGGVWQQAQPLLALFTVRMLREGTKRLSSLDIATQLDFYGAWLEQTCMSDYVVLTLYTLSKYLGQTLPIVVSMLREATFPEEEFRVCIENNIQHFRVSQSKVRNVAHRHFMNLLFGDNHPSGHLLVENDYRNLTTEKLRQHYEKYYQAGHTVMYVSGCVRAEVISQISEIVKDYTDTSTLQEQLSEVKPQRQLSPEKRHFQELSGSVQCGIGMGMLTIPPTHPDYTSLRFVTTLLGGYYGSRLMSNIREEKGYTYGISASVLPYADCSVLAITTETANAHVEPLIGEVYREIERLKAEPVSAEELQMVKNYLIADVCRSYESVLSMTDAWIYVHTNRLSNKYYETLAQEIMRLTPEDIKNISRKYLDVSLFRESVAGALG